MTNQLIDHALKQRGVSITKPRRQLYEVLARSEPLTMQELIASLPQYNKTTIYRTVELFENLGIIQRLQIGWKYKLELSNEYQDHHHHVTCTNCGQSPPCPKMIRSSSSCSPWHAPKATSQPITKLKSKGCAPPVNICFKT